MQSHKNQIHRLLLIDRVLQSNTFTRPDGATRESLEQSVRKLLTSDEAQFLTPLPFEQLWKGKDAFRKDLKFILTHYPGIMLKQGNKLWSYRDRGMSIFPRFGSTLDDKTIQEAILLLEHLSNHPLSKLLQVEDVICTLNQWYGNKRLAKTSNTPPHFQHQFSTEDEEVLTKETSLILQQCSGLYGRRIVIVEYISASSGESRKLEFHPWRFIESEHRWYVIGFISHDLLGNYPAKDRTDYPGLVLKLDAITNVSMLSETELDHRKSKREFMKDRHTYRTEAQSTAILSMDHRIGTGGWAQELGQEIQNRKFNLRFKIHTKAIPYFDSTGLQKHAKPIAHSQVTSWHTFAIPIDPSSAKHGIKVINRETIRILRSFGPRLEVIEPIELRILLHSEFRLAAQQHSVR